MRSALLRCGAAAATFTVLSACLPIEREVSLAGSSFQMSQIPLAPDEGIAILGWAGPQVVAVRGRAGMRYDDRIARCVRDALADASPATRIVALDQFRPAAGGVFATPDALITERAVGDSLRTAAASPAFASLNIRYVLMVEGATETRDRSDWGHAGAAWFVPIIIAGGRNNKRTHIRVTAWDATTARKQDAFETDASGSENGAFIAVAGWLAYAPTESTACKDIAGKIMGFISGDNPAGQ